MSERNKHSVFSQKRIDLSSNLIERCGRLCGIYNEYSIKITGWRFDVVKIELQLLCSEFSSWSVRFFVA